MTQPYYTTSLSYFVIFCLLYCMMGCNVNEHLTVLNRLGSARSGEPNWTDYGRDESVGDEPEVKDGILHFSSPESFTKAMAVLSRMSIRERVLYSKLKTFKSLLTVYSDCDSLLRKAEKNRDKLKYENILNNYSPYVKIGADSSLEYNFKDLVKASIVNQDGYVYIGKMLYYFSNNEQKIVFDGDKNKINNKSSDAVVSFKVQPQTLFEDASCPNGFSKTLMGDGRLGDIRDKLDVTVTKDLVYNSLFQNYSVFGSAYAVGKTQIKNAFGVWQDEVTGDPLTLISRWTLIAAPPIPKALATIVEDNTLTQYPTSQVQVMYLDHATPYSLMLANLSYSDGVSTTVYLTFPGTGYWTGSRNVPMTCP